MFERENAQKGSRPISSRWPGASCKSAARPVLPHVPRVLDESAGSFRTREETPRVREAAGKDRGARLRLTAHPRAPPFGFALCSAIAAFTSRHLMVAARFALLLRCCGVIDAAR